MKLLKIFALLLILLVSLLSVVAATNWITPQKDFNLRNIFNIFNAKNVSAGNLSASDLLCLRGTCVTTIGSSGVQNNTDAVFNKLNISGKLNCGSIDGGTDTDYCVDATGAGGGMSNLTDVNFNTVNISTSGIILNGSGLWSNITKISQRPIDNLICQSDRGYDTTGCDIVCGLEEDCFNKIYQSIRISNTHTHIRFGNYSLNQTTGSRVMNIFGCDNIIITSDYAIFDSRKNATNDLNTLVFKNCTNVYVQGIRIIGNKTCGLSKTCVGILLQDVTNVFLDNVEVRDMNSFQVFINAVNHTSNVHIFNSFFKGVGTADVIGGGPYNANATMDHIYIHNNIINQSLDIGTYGASLDIVGGDFYKFYDNHVSGHLVFGSETKRTANSVIHGNTVQAGNITSFISTTGRDDSFNNQFTNNIVYGGIFMSGYNGYVAGNIVIKLIPGTGMSIQGTGHKVINNLIIRADRGMILDANYSYVEGNTFLNTTNGSASVVSIPIVIASYSHDNKIKDNHIVNDNYMQYAIFLSANVSNNIIEDNDIINQFNLTNFMQISLNDSNNTIRNNILRGPGARSLKYAVAGSQTMKYNYVDDFFYSSIEDMLCGNLTVFNSRTINVQNGSSNYSISTCLDGQWRTLSFDQPSTLTLSSDLSNLSGKVNNLNFSISYNHLIHYYSFDYDVFGKALDLMGTNDGFFQNVTNNTGIIGNGYLFNGTRGAIYTNISLTGNGEITNKITFAVWVYPLDIITLRVIGGQYNSLGNGLESFGMYTLTTGFEWKLDNGSNQSKINDDGTPSANRWYFLVGTYNGTTSCFYVNGVLQNCDMNISGPIYSGANGNFTIGARPSNLSKFSFNGTIDEVMVYDVDLTQTDILRLYYQGLNGFQQIKPNSIFRRVANQTFNDDGITRNISNINSSLRVLNITFADTSYFNLIAYYSFDYDVNGKVLDLMGTNDGYSINVINSTGIIGNGYYFNVNSAIYTNISLTKENLINDQLTFSLWIYLNDTVTGRIIGGQYKSQGTQNDIFGFSTVATGLQWRVANGTNQSNVLDIGSPNVKTWYFLVGTYNGTTSCFYLNSILQDCDMNVSGNINKATFGNFTIGARPTNLSKIGINGTIDEVRVYNIALNQEQINNIYSRGLNNLQDIKPSSAYIYFNLHDIYLKGIVQNFTTARLNVTQDTNLNNLFVSGFINGSNISNLNGRLISLNGSIGGNKVTNNTDVFLNSLNISGAGTNLTFITSNTAIEQGLNWVVAGNPSVIGSFSYDGDNSWWTLNDYVNGGLTIMNWRMLATRPSVGIGLTNPQQALDVVGNVTISQNLNVSGKLSVNISFPTSTIHFGGQFNLSSAASRHCFSNGTCALICKSGNTEFAVCD